MTREELDAVMAETGVYFDPDHPDHIERSKISTLLPPFLTYSIQMQTFFAENIPYYQWPALTVRIYTDVDVDPAEAVVRNALQAAGVNTVTRKYYDNDLGLWEARLTGQFPGTEG